MTVDNLEKRLDELEDEDEETNDFDVQIKRLLVLPREKAEREGRDILGVADTPGETEYVKVDP